MAQGKKAKSHTSFDGSPVGYGKPPAQHQFKKGGKKPEDSGRKKNTENSRTIIASVLDETVQVTVGGERKNMSKREYLIRDTYDRAIRSPSVTERINLVRLYEKLAPQSVDPIPPIVIESMPGDEGL